MIEKKKSKYECLVVYSTWKMKDTIKCNNKIIAILSLAKTGVERSTDR